MMLDKKRPQSVTKSAGRHKIESAARPGLAGNLDCRQLEKPLAS
jgi:hypothetical protein